MRIRPFGLIFGFALILVACTGGAATDGADRVGVAACVESDDPVESLCGRALEGPTGVVLVIRDNVVDIDANTQTRIEGLPDGSGFVAPAEQPIWAQRIGSDAVIGVGDGSGGVEVFALSGESSRAVAIGFGIPTPGLGGVWLREKISVDDCRLSKVGLDGRTLYPPAPVDCDVSFIEETSLGLVGLREVDGVFSGVVVDAEDPSPSVFDGGMIRGVFGSTVLHQARGGSDFVLSDTLTGDETNIDLPIRVGQPGYGKLSPDGRVLAISFINPPHTFDIWVLDTETLQWTRVPSMPVASDVKATSFAWVPDGRLVLLLSLETGGHQLATWTPGDPNLEVRELGYELVASAAVLCTLPECG